MYIISIHRPIYRDLFLIFFLCSFFSSLFPHEPFNTNRYTNQAKIEVPLSAIQESAIKELIFSFSTNDHPADSSQFLHKIEEINVETRELVLEDRSTWTIRWLHRNAIKSWKPGDRLKVSKAATLIYNISFENLDAKNTVRGKLLSFSDTVHANSIARISISPFISSAPIQLQLDNGMILSGPSAEDWKKTSWKPGDKVFILHHKEKQECLHLWHVKSNQLIKNWDLSQNSTGFLNLEDRLSKKVLGQSGAIKTVVNAILNYEVGLKNPETPIGVFLFFGPTGVGKTELAKALAEELYQKNTALVRFDMSNFTDYSTYTRLIGSPPGYVNHEEGGQLTNALRECNRCVVLLDEIEKAHSSIRKVFLPVFDEGYICDHKNRKISCKDLIFIMTSNLCSSDILEFNQKGYSNEEILNLLESTWMSELSPEFYNRIQPVVFNPIGMEIMGDLVDLVLQDIIQRIKEQKNITLTIGEAARTYLMQEGYHPSLGARFLKKLVEKKVTTTFAYALVHENIPEGSSTYLSYNPENDTWFVEWW